MFEETVVEAAVVEATPAVEAEAVEVADVVLEPAAEPELALELLAICWNLPSRRL